MQPDGTHLTVEVAADPQAVDSLTQVLRNQAEILRLLQANSDLLGEFLSQVPDGIGGILKVT